MNAGEGDVITTCSVATVLIFSLACPVSARDKTMQAQLIDVERSKSLVAVSPALEALMIDTARRRCPTGRSP
jgi:hypothetical protein